MKDADFICTVPYCTRTRFIRVPVLVRNIAIEQMYLYGALKTTINILVSSIENTFTSKLNSSRADEFHPNGECFTDLPPRCCPGINTAVLVSSTASPKYPYLSFQPNTFGWQAQTVFQSDSYECCVILYNNTGSCECAGRTSGVASYCLRVQYTRTRGSKERRVRI
jgi:hypothetical protein